MKIEKITIQPENYTGGLYISGYYSIDPMNMQKRVRVFINQLLPEIQEQAKTIPDIKFAYEEILRLTTEFIRRLEREGLFEDGVKVQNAAHEEIIKLIEKYTSSLKHISNVKFKGIKYETHTNHRQIN